MTTEDPFISEMRTNLNAFNAKAEERAAKARKAQRRTRRNRYIGYALAAILGIGVGTAIVNATEAEAVSQVRINKYIRANGGIPPCKHEDGSGQPGLCFWDASERGNGKGHDYLAASVKGKDDRIIYITGPKAKRY